MKAVICTGYGSPEVLKIGEWPKPIPKQDEILVKINASAVNSGDCRIRRANPAVVKLFFGFSKPRFPILGSVLAGEIVDVGSGVKEFRIGDRVFAMTGVKMGAYAEYCLIPEGGCVTKVPENISFIQASAIPFGGTTALHFLRKAEVKKNEKVLVYGASGAVGCAAVQLLVNMGADVTAVCGPQNIELVSELGAEKVLDYTKDDLSQFRKYFDLVFETVNKLTVPEAQSLVKHGGKIILVAADFGTMANAGLKNIYGEHTFIFGPAPEKRDDLRFLAELVLAGRMKPVIDRIYTLEQIKEAHEYVDKGHKKGNVVITI